MERRPRRMRGAIRSWLTGIAIVALVAGLGGYVLWRRLPGVGAPSPEGIAPLVPEAPGGAAPPGASGTSGAMPSGDGAPTPGSRRQSTYPPSPATSATIAMPVSHDRIAPLIRLGLRSMRQPPAKHTGARAGMHHCVAADSLADGEDRAVPRRMRSMHGSVQS